MRTTDTNSPDPDFSSSILSMIIQMRIDIASCFIEDGEPVAVYFRNRVLLETWIRAHGLRIRTEQEKTIEISGWILTTSGKCWTHQLWVRRDNGGYRKAFVDLVASKYDLSNSDLKKTNVDHVVNTKRVQHPEAWILLFPVPAGANQTFGSIVERWLPKIAKNVDRVDMTEIMCFKLFCGWIPNSRKDLKRVMRNILGQIYSSTFCGQMERTISPYIKRRPLYSNVREDEADTTPLPPFQGYMVRWIGKT